MAIFRLCPFKNPVPGSPGAVFLPERTMLSFPRCDGQSGFLQNSGSLCHQKHFSAVAKKANKASAMLRDGKQVLRTRRARVRLRKSCTKRRAAHLSKCQCKKILWTTELPLASNTQTAAKRKTFGTLKAPLGSGPKNHPTRALDAEDANGRSSFCFKSATTVMRRIGTLTHVRLACVSVSRAAMHRHNAPI